MRLSPAAAYFALAALVAGCSASSPGAVPGTSSPTIGGNHRGFSGRPHLPNGPMTPKAMLKWLAAGTMLGPMPPDLMREVLRGYASHPSFPVHDAHAKVGMWVSNYGLGDLYGQTKAGNVNVMTVTPASNGCDNGPTARTFANNLWDTCSETTAGSNTYDTGGVQEYSEQGVLENTYNGGCPTNLPPSECASFTGYAGDSFENANYVFVANLYMENYDCSQGSCAWVQHTGWEYWPNGHPSAQPTMIDVLDQVVDGVEIGEVTYGDVDGNNDIYAVAYGCSAGSQCGQGILEVANATTGTPTLSWVIPIGAIQGSQEGYACLSGLYLSNKNEILNVTETTCITSAQVLRYKVGQWSGPMATWTGGEEPFFGSFSKGDKMMAIGDEEKLIDLFTNQGAYSKVNSPSSLSSATYVEADK